MKWMGLTDPRLGDQTDPILQVFMGLVEKRLRGEQWLRGADQHLEVLGHEPGLDARPNEDRGNRIGGVSLLF